MFLSRATALITMRAEHRSLSRRVARRCAVLDPLRLTPAFLRDDLHQHAMASRQAFTRHCVFN
jgi:hypothetical protein